MKNFQTRFGITVIATLAACVLRLAMSMLFANGEAG